MRYSGKLFFVATLILLSCTTKKMDDINISSGSVPISAANNRSVTYLALGDSYTIGEAVTASQSFPYQLSGQMQQSGINVGDPTIIARTGWTTDELINAINTSGVSSKFTLVTLLIGVNNQYRGYNFDTYRAEFTQLLGTAINYAGGNKNHVFVLSIPDWSATPFAASSGRDLTLISAEIDKYNDAAKQECTKEGISYTNITDISRKAATDKSLIAPDGLHPSGSMYTQWVQQLFPQVKAGLADVK